MENPPYDTRYTLAMCFGVFREEILKEGEVEQKVLEEKYDSFMGEQNVTLYIKKLDEVTL